MKHDSAGRFGDALADLEQKTKRAPRRFTLRRFADVVRDRNLSAGYLVKGLLPSEGLAVVYGPPKCGKSFWIFDLVMHVALGLPYRGHKVRQGEVVYLALEGQHGFPHRMEAWRRHHHVTDPAFHLVTDRLNLVADHAGLTASIKDQLAADVTPAAVVIDTLNRSLAGSESKDADMAAYLGAAEGVREAFNCLVAVVHHSGVQPGRPRGHTSLPGAVDVQFAVKREAGTIEAELEFMKDGPQGEVLASRLQVVTVGTDDDGDDITSCVIEPAGPGARGRAVVTVPRVAKSVRVFREAVAEALDGPDARTITPRPGWPTVRAVPIEAVRAEFNVRHATGEEGDAARQRDARRKAFSRVLGNLPTDFATCVRGDQEWIWRTTSY